MGIEKLRRLWLKRKRQREIARHFAAVRKHQKKQQEAEHGKVLPPSDHT